MDGNKEFFGDFLVGETFGDGDKYFFFSVCEGFIFTWQGHVVICLSMANGIDERRWRIEDGNYGIKLLKDRTLLQGRNQSD